MDQVKVNLNYRNIEARRFTTANIPININNNSTLVSVSGLEDKLSVNFVFSSNYEPNVGIIRIEGELYMEESKENIKRAMVEWEQSGRKNLPKDIAEKVHNAILSSCIIEATVLSREVQLPAPIPTPHISMDQKNLTSVSEDTSTYIR